MIPAYICEGFPISTDRPRTRQGFDARPLVLCSSSCLRQSIWHAVHRLGDFAAVFAFASPQNQAATGPLERFRAMLHTPAYVPLIKHRDASIVTTMQVVLVRPITVPRPKRHAIALLLCRSSSRACAEHAEASAAWRTW
jgi:hypothetical protein